MMMKNVDGVSDCTASTSWGLDLFKVWGDCVGVHNRVEF